VLASQSRAGEEDSEQPTSQERPSTVVFFNDGYGGDRFAAISFSSKVYVALCFNSSK
jgi:hypothetical protein